MKTIKCLLADDELYARQILEDYIAQVDYLELIGVCRNGVETFNAVSQQASDLLFLDINMPYLSGRDLLKTVPTLPPVILTTAYSDFALESYQFRVIDYLLKPIPFDRFLKAIHKFNGYVDPIDISLKSATVLPHQPAFIYVRSEKKMVKVVLNDILFIEGLKDYVKIHTKDTVLITYETLTSFADRLPDSQFIRIHRSFIISLQQINSFTARLIQIGEQELPIGESYLKRVTSKLASS